MTDITAEALARATYIAQAGDGYKDGYIEAKWDRLASAKEDVSAVDGRPHGEARFASVEYDVLVEKAAKILEVLNRSE